MPEDRLPYPKVVRCALFEVTLLGRCHLLLLMDLLLGALLALAAALAPLWSRDPLNQTVLDIAPFVVYELCVCMLLMRIDSISFLVASEHKLCYWQREMDRLVEMREDMLSFWTDIQHLTDLWIYHTIPRMDLMKRIHSWLEAAEPGVVIPQLIALNQRLHHLQKVMGGRTASSGADKCIADQMIAIIASSSLDALLTNLDQILAHDLLTCPLVALPEPARTSDGVQKNPPPAGGVVELSAIGTSRSFAARRSSVIAPDTLALQFLHKKSVARSSAFSEYWEDDTVSDDQRREADKFRARLEKKRRK